MSDKPKKSFIWDDVLEDESPDFSQAPKEQTTKPKATEQIKDEEFSYKVTKDTPVKPTVEEIEIDEIDDEQEIEYYSDIPQKKNKVNRKRLVLLLLLLILVALYFTPVYKVENVKMNETSFVTKEQMLKSLEITEGERYSLYKMNSLKHNLDEESVTASSSKYNIPQKTLTVQVDEIKPLAKNEDNELYYEQNSEVNIATEINYYVPTIEDVNQDQELEIIDQLKELDYNIIKEMSLITSANNEDRSNLVYIQMKDGNYVEIGINQIALKMQYYMQMKAIIDQEADGEVGILHLNIGDYYEPL